MTDYRKIARNGLLTGGCFLPPVQTNAPPQYGDKRHEYFAEVTKEFNAQISKYSSDYVDGVLELASPDGTVTERNVTGRFSNVVTTTASITRKYDDYKNVLFDQKDIGYVRPGSKLTTMGSVWLAINPDNVSSPTANGIFRRCNAVWNYLDYYGNVVSEPIIVENEAANADAPDAQQDQRIAVGYFTVTCQYNDFTRQINDNTRLILGSKAYQVTGYADFKQEFTGDYSTVRLLTFHVRTLTSNDETDDMERHIAGGKAFSWEIAIDGQGIAYVGNAAKYTASSVRNGQNVESTEEYPIDYIWISSDPSVATVTQDGTVTPIQPGAVTITAELAQNGEIAAQKQIEVRNSGYGLQFVNAPPAVMEAFQTTEIVAVAFVGGEPSDYTDITWEFSGADESAYSVTTDKNRATVTCYGYSKKPLIVKAKAYVLEQSAEIRLMGW